MSEIPQRHEPSEGCGRCASGGGHKEDGCCEEIAAKQQSSWGLAIAIVVSAIVLGLSAWAFAETAPGVPPRLVVGIKSYGIYEAELIPLNELPEDAPARKNPLVSGTPRPIRLTHLEKTYLIPNDPLVRFGFEFVLLPPEDYSGRDPKRLMVRLTHPVLTDPVLGRKTSSNSWEISAALNASTYVGWEFGATWERVPGTWVMELYDGDMRLASQVFEVVAPAARRLEEIRYELPQTVPVTERAEQTDEPDKQGGRP